MSIIEFITPKERYENIQMMPQLGILNQTSRQPFYVLASLKHSKRDLLAA